MNNSILIDTSFLYAFFYRKEPRHEQALRFAKTASGALIMPDAVLVEAAFLFNTSGGISAVLYLLDKLRASGFKFEPIHPDDLPRIREIMATYADAKFDILDCCSMALAEKLDIRRICTFDRRDFSIFRPKHCDHLELLP